LATLQRLTDGRADLNQRFELAGEERRDVRGAVLGLDNFAGFAGRLEAQASGPPGHEPTKL
jgi:hypothetical protein